MKKKIDDDAVLDLYRQGYKYKEIAKMLGYNESTVSLHLKRMGATSSRIKMDYEKIRKLNEEGKTILKDMDLEKVDLDVGVNAIIGSMLKNNYITVYDSNTDVTTKTSNWKLISISGPYEYPTSVTTITEPGTYSLKYQFTYDGETKQTDIIQVTITDETTTNPGEGTMPES